MGPWTRTGDKYFEDQEGYYVYCGRSDDMLKSQRHVRLSRPRSEAALIAHEDVLEAAVVGAPDDDGLIKPKAYVGRKIRRRHGRGLRPGPRPAFEEHARAIQMPTLVFLPR